MVVIENDNNDEKEATLRVILKNWFYKTNLDIARRVILEALVAMSAPHAPGDEPSLSEAKGRGAWLWEALEPRGGLYIEHRACTLTCVGGTYVDVYFSLRFFFPQDKSKKCHSDVKIKENRAEINPTNAREATVRAPWLWTSGEFTSPCFSVIPLTTPVSSGPSLALTHCL